MKSHSGKDLGLSASIHNMMKQSFPDKHKPTKVWYWQTENRMLYQYMHDQPMAHPYWFGDGTMNEKAV